MCNCTISLSDKSSIRITKAKVSISFFLYSQSLKDCNVTNMTPAEDLVPYYGGMRDKCKMIHLPT